MFPVFLTSKKYFLLYEYTHNTHTHTHTHTHTQMILLILRFCSGTFMIIHRHVELQKKLSQVMYTFPAKVKQGDTLSSFFSSHTVNKYHFHGKCSASFSTFSCFMLLMYWSIDENITRGSEESKFVFSHENHDSVFPNSYYSDITEYSY